MSAFEYKADMTIALRNVYFSPKVDMRGYFTAMRKVVLTEPLGILTYKATHEVMQKGVKDG